MNRDGVEMWGRIVYDGDWSHNLVLDQGLDLMCSTSARDYVDQMLNGCAGFDGVADSVALISNISQTGTTVTAVSLGTFSGADVGKIITWDSDPNGTQVRVVTFLDSQNVEVDRAQSVGAGAGTIHIVSRTSLGTERSGANSNTPLRSSTYLDGGNGLTHSSGSPDYLYWRTYDFSSQISSVVYREVAVSQSTSVGANIFNRIRLPGDVAVDAGQQLRMLFELYVTVGPAVVTAASPTITGWGAVPGTECLGPNDVMMRIASNGATQNPATFGRFLAPAQTSIANSSGGTGSLTGSVSPVSTALANFQATGVNRTGGLTANSTTLQSYSPGTFFRDVRCVYTAAQGATTVRSCSLSAASVSAGSASVQLFNFLADADQLKADTHQLVLDFRRSVGRLFA